MANLKTPAEIELMAEAGKRLAEILAALAEEVKSGIVAKFLDVKSLALIKKAGCEPAFLGYHPYGAKRPYPATLCVSVNEVVVHGVPSNRIIADGDLVKLDLGVRWKGWYADAAVTIGVGAIDAKKKKLIGAAKRALELGIAEAAPGKTLGDIGFAIERHVASQDFSVVESLTGHGIGKALHEEPSVFNFGARGQGMKLKAGMVLAIEPMISAGAPPGGGKVKQLSDDSYATRDGSPTAHFEHTVAITEEGPRILTRI